MGMFDDLIPAAPAARSGMFADLIPAPPSDTPPVAMTDAPPLADLLMEALVPAYENPAPGKTPAGLTGAGFSGAGFSEAPPALPQVVDPTQISPLARPQNEDGLAGNPSAQINPRGVSLAGAPIADQSSIAGDLEAAWLQAQQIIPGARAGMALDQIQTAGAIQAREAEGTARARQTLAEMEAALPTIAPEHQAEWIGDMDRVRQEIAAAEAKTTQPEYAPAMERVRGQEAAGLDTLAAVLPTILGKSDEIAAIPMNPAAAKMGQADTWGETFGALGEDPVGVLRTYGLRSLGTSVPSMLAAIGGSALGPMGAAGAAGAVGAGTEAAMSVAQAMEAELRAAGVDVSSPEALAAYVNGDPAAFDGILRTALTRAGVIGAVDAATGGITGGLARSAAASGRASRVGAAIGAGGIVEPAGEAAGEAAAQLATAGEIKPGDVLAEALGGLAVGAPTTAGQVAMEAMRGGTATPAPAPTPADMFADLIPPAAPAMPDQASPPVAAPAAPPELSISAPIAAPPVPPAVQQPLSTKPSEIGPAPLPVDVQPATGAAAAQNIVSTNPAGNRPGATLQPQEPNAPAPVPPVAPVPVSAAPEVDPAEVPEPAPSQRRPLTYLARRAGIQIDPSGPAGQELKANGITPRTNPGLFRLGGMTDVDNIVAAENPELQQILGVDDTGNYLPRNEVISALIDEANGIPRRGADQMEAAARRREWTDLQAGLTQEAPRDDTPAEWIITDPERDISPAPDRTARVTAAVDRVIAETNLGAILRPDERSAIIDRLDREGGSVEQAIEHEIIRTVLNAEAGQPVADDRQPIPGWDDEGEDEGASGGGAGRPAGEPVQPTGGDARAPDDRRARSGTLEGGSVDLTPEGQQTVIPGAERITDREQAERQMEKPKRGGDKAPGGLFDDDARNQQSLFETRDAGAEPLSRPAAPSSSRGKADTAARDEGSAQDAAARKPQGRLSPRFLDFSFTNRQSVYGAAYRDAGVHPAEAANWPVERQLEAVRKAVESRFGVKVELPSTKVRTKNLVGRMVTRLKQSITPREALDQLLDAYRQMQMLASIMGVPERAIALEMDGQPLTLSLVSVKRLNHALGVFSWGADGRTITLPGRSNSFAHEWAHALDHFLGQNSGKDGIKGLFSRKVDDQGIQRPLSPRAALADAFTGIMRALYGDAAQMSALVLRLQVEAAQIGKDGKPTPVAMQARKIMTGIREGRRPPAEYLSAYFKSSAEYDRLSGTAYYTDPAEMFARAFEAWAGRTVAMVAPDLPQAFLSKSAWAYDTDADPRLAMTFPKGADALAFAVAMTELSHAMSVTSLFPGAKALAPEDVDIFSDNALLRRLPKTSLAEKEKAAWREMIATWRGIMGGGTKAALRSGTALARGFWNDAFTSLTAAMHGVARRQKNPEARRAIENIADMIGADPGSGRFIGRIWQQDVEMQVRRNLRKIDGALAKGWRDQRMTAEDSAALRALLTGQNPKASPRLKALAADLRSILNAIWYDLKAAGIEVGYASTYLPRVYDKDAVAADSTGFRAKAAEVYGLMFDREVIQNSDEETQRADMNTVIRKLRAARMPTTEGETVPASRLSASDEKMIEAWRKSRATLRDLLRKAETDSTSPTLGQRIADAEEAETNLRAGVLDMLKERFADYSAENWHTRMMVGAANDFDTMGPTASFLKGRTLPQEADQILAGFMDPDPISLISGYIHAAARRAEYAKRFGPDGSKLENMLAAAVKAGATGDDVSLVRRAVNSATGRMKGASKAFERINSLVYAYGTLAMLGRATFASIAEPIVAGLRSGDVRDSFKAVASTIRQLIPGERKDDMFDLARVIGLVSSSIHEGVMENRLGADSAALTKGASRVVSEFFRRSLLAPLTNLQQTAMIPVAHGIIMRHLQTWDRGGQGKTFANGELNELGIAADDRAAMLDWLKGMDMPRPDDLLAPDGSFYNPAAELWANAVVRLTNQSIQNPLKSDRPIMANHPMTAALYGIMGFIMAFHRHVLVRNVRRFWNADGFEAKGFRFAQASIGVGMLFLGQLLATIIREALFNRETWEEKDDDDELLDWLIERAFFRTGLTGVFDPLIQLGIGVRYERDLTTVTAGPHLGYMLQNLQRMLAAFQGRNSPNTNTGEWNATKAAYQLAIQPGLMALATALPGGPISGLASTGTIMWGSSPWASDTFANTLVGEKKTSHKDVGDGERPWWELGDVKEDEAE